MVPRRMFRSAQRLGLALALALPLSGCVVGSADIELEVDALAWELRPLEVQAETELSVGRAVLGLASFAARHADDEEAELAAELLDDISRVHVGTYHLEGRRDRAPRFFGEDARESLEDLGWRPVMRLREESEDQWILVRTLPRERFEMLVVGLDHREMIVVKLEGDLAGIVDHAVRRDADLVAMTRRAGEDY